MNTEDLLVQEFFKNIPDERFGLLRILDKSLRKALRQQAVWLLAGVNECEMQCGYCLECIMYSDFKHAKELLNEQHEEQVIWKVLDI